MPPRAKFRHLLAAVKQNRHGPFLDHEPVLLDETDVVQIEDARELIAFASPHSAGEINAVFRKERVVAVRAELGVVPNPLAALRTLEPPVRCAVPAIGAEPRPL